MKLPVGIPFNYQWLNPSDAAPKLDLVTFIAQWGVLARWGVWPGEGVFQHAMGQTHPCGQTDTCENITFANFVCGR